MAPMMVCNSVRGQWVTCTVPTVKAVNTVNRARSVIDKLRPMVHQTWWVQASYDFVIWTRFGTWGRELDRFLQNAGNAKKIPRIGALSSGILLMIR